ncbi:DNA polymerase III subunit delta' [Dokdonella koreensis]|uniref:DNA-directed DNA polymerase n=1 Tax=Dokdonella koreensis DS-123 TaxID=1300342 RepID=A0A160DVB6_9GAMM|nr:DNA polymerase III subunit delta' [Dokdonella koreensis]ANB18284.1 DNA polymerase III, delta'' subunit [Dokdonella koreensis DS-123]
MNGTIAPWLDAAWQRLRGALAAGRLHHALLIAGPAGLGKRALAEALVAVALCEQPGAAGACGRCRACQLMAAGTHPDRVRVGFVERDDGKLRSELTIDQIRALSARLALSSQFGGLQLAIVEPAEAMNVSAANALLKTLEEPATDTIMILVADQPARLPATIRSRCQRIDVGLPPPAQALAWLREQGLADAPAREALAASAGNPGQALAWSKDGRVELGAACAGDLVALAGGRSSAGEVAERWAADRPADRLWFAAVLADEEAQRLAAGERGRFGLTAVDEIPKLAAWFAKANQARRLLDTPLRPELVLLDVLRAWPATGQGTRRS